MGLDVNSASIHILDDISYDILNMDDEKLLTINEVIDSLKNKYSTVEIQEAYSEIEDLINEGTLFSDDIDYVKVSTHAYRDNGIKAMCLNIAHDCNLRCKYCFASTGDYKTGRTLMSKEVARKSIDYLIEHSGTRKNIEVDFFGGEPMLNFDVVVDAVHYGEEKAKKANKKFFFTITTNGTILDDDKLKFLNEKMSNIVISIDGRKEVHDRMRAYASGKGSYDLVVKNAKRIVAGRNGKAYFIRGTYTVNNLDFSNDILHLASLGFKEISIEPVTGTGRPESIEKENIERILKEYDDFTLTYLENLKGEDPYRFYHFTANIYDGTCIYKRAVGCGAGSEYVAISPDGGIYACHQFTGIDEFKLGNVYEGITNTSIRERFNNCNVFTKEKCNKCWAKYYCSGGCYANSYFTNNSIAEPDDLVCTLQKKRIECALMIEASMSLI